MSATLSLFDRPTMLRDRPLAPVPAERHDGNSPRDYQTRAIGGVLEAFDKHRSTLAILATGLGKTVIAAELARLRGDVLFIAHRETLIDQAAQKLRRWTGAHVAVEKAERRSKGGKFVVASVQSLKGDRLRFFAASHQHIKTIIIDECHRAVSKSYRDVLSAFPDAKVLGLTATADRGDKRALGLVFESVAFEYHIADGLADGWLTRGDWMPLSVDGISLDDIGLKGNDIDQGALDEALVLQVAQIAGAMHGAANGEMSLAFCPGVKVAEAAAEALNRLQPGCARATWGEQDFAVRKAIEDAWVRGDFPYLLNCALYIEGADFPKLRNVFMFAATKSRLRWAQIYGRGTRLWPHGIDHLSTVEERLAAIAASPKPRWKFFDAQYGKHGHTLAGPVDLLGGRYDDETKERAKKNLAERGGNVGEALELAKAELEEERRKKLARLAAKAAKAKGTVLVGAARAACELFGVSTEASDEPRPEDYVEAATAQYLEDKGVKGAAKMPWAAARELERTLRQRAARGLCSYKQQKSLTFRGVANAVALTSTQASRLMSVVAPYNERHDWGWRFAPGQPEAILGLREPGSDDT